MRRQGWNIGSVLQRRVAAGLLVASGLIGAAPAQASDFSHICASADGSYVVNDGELYDAAAYRNGGAKPISHRPVSEVVLAEREGYCESNANWASGQRFRYTYRQYVRTLAFRSGGERVEIAVFCELAADGLPAALTCDNRVETKSAALPTQPVVPDADQDGRVTISLWDHNGSRMRLVAEGAKRAFVYDQPRRGVQAAGARRGVTLFEGRRVGDRYEGTAFVFSSRCGSRPFGVTGVVGPDDRTVTMTGEVETLNADCAATGTRTETLTFTLIP